MVSECPNTAVPAGCLIVNDGHKERYARSEKDRGITENFVSQGRVGHFYFRWVMGSCWKF